MPYDKNFYKMYGEYLQERIVRKNHDRAFRHLAELAPALRVLDVGCGIGEYDTYDSRHGLYVGIDLNNAGKLANFIKVDYSKADFTKKIKINVNAFVSLFSIEPCNPPLKRYEIYAKIFRRFPGIVVGMSAGFYYESKRKKLKVGEAGGIVSYQTIEDPKDYVSKIFSEKRLIMKTPSKMFGKDVVEVWKFFERKQ